MVAMSSPWRDPRTSVFYVRRGVPADLRSVLGKREYKASLGTKDPKEAKTLFPAALAKCERVFAEARRNLSQPEISDMPREQAERLAEVWLSQLLEEDEEIQRDGSGDAALFLSVKGQVVAANGASNFTDADATAEYGLSGRDFTKRQDTNTVVSAGLKDALARGDVRPVLDDVEDFTASHGLRIRKDSAAYKALAFAFLKAAVRANEVAERRLNGEAVDTPKAPEVAQIVGRDGNGGGPVGEAISTIYKSWKTERRPSSKLTSEWDKAIRRFTELHGDLPIKSVTRRHVSSFKDALLKLPARPSATIRKLPVPKALKLLEGDTTTPTLSPASVKKDLAAIHAVMAWAMENGYREDNPATGIRIREAKNKADERLPYDVADLDCIFASPIYTKGERPRGGGGEAAYWLPLLGLMTGARLEELGQLRVSDVRHDGDVWYLDINTLDDGKKLKTRSSHRKVPLHTELVRLQFVGYFDQRHLSGEKAAIFPDLKADRHGVVTGNWSKWWGHYQRDVVGIKDKRKVFHSFRHSFKDACRAASVEEAIHDRLTGHSGGGVGRSYGAGYTLSVLNTAMRKIRFKIGIRSE